MMNKIIGENNPSFAEALAYWWRLGWLSFGGPAGQIAMMQHNLVHEKQWLDEKSFLHALWLYLIAIAAFLGIFLLPFPLLLIIAAGIGMLKHWQNTRQANLLASNHLSTKVLNTQELSHTKSKITKASPWLKIVSWSLGLSR